MENIEQVFSKYLQTKEDIDKLERLIVDSGIVKNEIGDNKVISISEAKDLLQIEDYKRQLRDLSGRRTKCTSDVYDIIKKLGENISVDFDYNGSIFRFFINDNYVVADCIVIGG